MAHKQKLAWMRYVNKTDLRQRKKWASVNGVVSRKRRVGRESSRRVKHMGKTLVTLWKCYWHRMLCITRCSLLNFLFFLYDGMLGSSGIAAEYTTGANLCILIFNSDQNLTLYEVLGWNFSFRPSAFPGWYIVQFGAGKGYFHRKPSIPDTNNPNNE